MRTDPRIDFRFLDRVATIRPEQVAEADALLLSDARVTAESFGMIASAISAIPPPMAGA